MKSRLYALGVALLLSFVVLLSSCQKLPYLTAKIADQDFKAFYILAFRGNYSADSKGFVILAGKGTDLQTTEFLAILVKGDQPAEYNLDVDLNTGTTVTECEAFYFPSGESDTTGKYVAQKGYVKITNVDLDKNRISGQFEFDMVNVEGNTIKVTNGQFGDLVFVNITDSLSQYIQFGD